MGPSIKVSVGSETVDLLWGVNIVARPCEFVLIVGANVSGERVLLTVVTGTLRPSEGHASIPNHDLSRYLNLVSLKIMYA
jgi:ABC-type hemin transport system ATPase subunit